MSDWPQRMLDDLCLKITDGAHNSPKSVPDGKPMASVKDLTRFGVDLSKARLIAKEDFKKLVKQGCMPEVGDVLIAKDGNSALDTVCNIKEPLDAVLLSSVAILRPDPNQIDSDFLKYYFSSKATINYFKSNFISGAAIPRVVLKDFKKAEILLPSLTTQKSIASILNSLEDKIELNRKINRTLEQIAQTIFKSWFVDFEPVKAKIIAKHNGQDPERAAMCAISGKSENELDQLSEEQRQQLASTAALFPDELQGSDADQNPKRWSKREIGEWGNIICGKTPPKKDSSNFGGCIPFIKIPDMHGNVFITRTRDSLSFKGANLQKKKQIPKGSICVSCIATVGQVVITSMDSYTNQQINSIVPINQNCTPYLYFCLLERYDLLQDLASGGSTTLNLNTRNFSKIPLDYPGEELLEAYAKLAVPLLDSILEKENQSQLLHDIKNSLLPKLLSGEISTNGFQKIAEVSHEI